MDQPVHLRGVIAFIKAGDRVRARALLSDILLANPRDELAWLWLSAAVSSPAEQRECLRRVLAINPQNLAARRGLAELERNAPPTGASSKSAGAPDPAQSAPATPSRATASASSNLVSNTSQRGQKPVTRVTSPDPAILSGAIPLPVSSTPTSAAPNQEQPAAPEPPAEASVAPAKVTRPSRRTASFVHPINDRVGAYTIVERVGKRDERELYLARQQDPNWLFWLVCDARPIGTLDIPQQQEALSHNHRHYRAIAAAGTRIELIQKLVGGTHFRFAARRWIEIAEVIGYHHERGQVYKKDQRFTLQSFIIGGDGRIAPVSFVQVAPDVPAYVAPEEAHGAISPTSDVYALGASLLTMIGEAPPELVFHKRKPIVGALKKVPALYRVLKKATDSQPGVRYPSGNEFARALRRIVDQLPAEESLIARSHRWVMLAGAVATVLIAVVLAIAFYGVNQAAAAVQPTAVVVQPTAAVPTGQFELHDLEIAHTEPGNGSASFRLSKGGAIIPEGAPLEISLFHNLVEVRDLRVNEQRNGRYRLDFSTTAPVGTYELVVRMTGEESRYFTYFDPSEGPESLAQMSLGGMQVDMQNYPEFVVYFGLLDEQGQPVRLGGNANVSILQDGELIERFTMQPVDTTREPVTVALAIDVSGSMYGEPIAAAREAAATFVQQLRPEDQACLYIFATEVQRLVQCTRDHVLVLSTIAGLATIDDTSLYDALSTISSDMRGIEGRSAIVVLSDGADTKSRATFETALDSIRASNLPVYAIGLLSERFDGAVLQRLADEANAIYLEAPSLDELSALYDSIEQQLANQYRLDFASAFPDRREGTLTIRISQNGQSVEFTRDFSGGS